MKKLPKVNTALKSSHFLPSLQEDLGGTSRGHTKGQGILLRLRYHGDPSSLQSFSQDVGYATQFATRAILYVDY